MSNTAHDPYVHQFADLCFGKAVKPRLRGEVYPVGYIDDFVGCFQYRSETIRFQKALRKYCETISEKRGAGNPHAGFYFGPPIGWLLYKDKRRYGLGRILERLEQSIVGGITSQMFAMNLERRLRILCALYLSLIGSFHHDCSPSSAVAMVH